MSTTPSVLELLLRPSPRLSPDVKPQLLTLHTFKASTTGETLTHYQVQVPAQRTPTVLWIQLLCDTLRKHFPERAASLMLVFLKLQLILQPQLLQTRDSQFKTPNGSERVLKELSNSPLKHHKSGLHCVHCLLSAAPRPPLRALLSALSFKFPQQQFIKL